MFVVSSPVKVSRHKKRAAAVCIGLITTALALGACGGSSDSESQGDQGDRALNGGNWGSWTGTLTGSDNSKFQIFLTFDTLRQGQISGTVYFPKLGSAGECSGAEVYREKQGDTYRFTEVIPEAVNPKCAGLGTVRVTPNGDSLDYSWTNGTQSSTGALHSYQD